MKVSLFGVSTKKRLILLLCWLILNGKGASLENVLL